MPQTNSFAVVLRGTITVKEVIDMGIKMEKKQGYHFPKKKKSYNIWHIALHGDIRTKLTFLILGFGNLMRGQIIKGLLFLFMELGFVWYAYNFGVLALRGLRHLGENKQSVMIDPTTQLPVKTAGDNSMLFLLAGVVAIFVFLVFFLMWRASIRSSFEAQKQQEKGKKLPTFRKDVATYFDRNVHRTLLFLPCMSVLIFNILPLAYMILIAFTNFDKEHQPPGNLFTWVGVENFMTMLNSGSVIGRTFWPVLLWTLVWAVFATVLNYILGLILALIIQRKGTRLKKMWRTIFVLSIAVPQFVSLLVIRSMLAANGPINVLLMNLEWIQSPLPFLTNPLWAKITIIIVNLWVGVPYTMLITTGVIQNIPADLYESAKVDGANAITTFFKITLPYMIFITTPYLITQFVGNINNFNVIYFLTAGEPTTNNYYIAGHTDLLVTWLYKLTANSSDYSYAAVIGIFVFVLSAVFSLITYRKTASYNGEETFQ